MEIERKWRTHGWPRGLGEGTCVRMRQGYLTTVPTVRIRSQAREGQCEYVLCFKGKPDPQGLAREEIEIRVEEEQFRRLEALIGKPLIEKEQRRYPLEGGLVLEVNQVDRGQPGEFFYAEVEFPSLEQARAWQPGEQLREYLSREVTGQRGESMAAYWQQTRG